MRILITDGMDKSAIAELKNKGHEIVEQFYSPEELGEALRGFDAVVIRSATKIRKAQLDMAKDSQLKLIVRGGVGVDNIDVADAEAMGITVRNTPNASSMRLIFSSNEPKTAIKSSTRSAFTICSICLSVIVNDLLIYKLPNIL